MARKHESYTPPLYGAYLFIAKEPAIDELRTCLEDEYGGKISRKMLRDVHLKGGPSVAAMGGWFFGKTMRPQSSSMEAAGRAAGWRRTWVRISTAERGKIADAIKSAPKRKALTRKRKARKNGRS
jgi:hypothetical protein